MERANVAPDEFARETANEAAAESSVPNISAAGVEESAPAQNSGASRATPLATSQPGVSRPQPKLGTPIRADSPTFRPKNAKRVANTLFSCIARIGISA